MTTIFVVAKIALWCVISSGQPFFGTAECVSFLQNKFDEVHPLRNWLVELDRLNILSIRLWINVHHFKLFYLNQIVSLCSIHHIHVDLSHVQTSRLVCGPCSMKWLWNHGCRDVVDGECHSMLRCLWICYSCISTVRQL